MMNKFVKKANRCEALGSVYNAVLSTRDMYGDWNDEKEEYERPTEEYCIIRWDTWEEVLKAIKKML